MFNWNPHMRGTGFPQQQFMQHMAPFQAAHQWGQYQQPAMGMMMGQGWPAAGQQAMFPQQGMMPGVLNMPVPAVMGGVGLAQPPSQPPPPLPAEPPPLPSPNVKPPTPPPPPSSEDTSTSQQAEQKKSKWDQQHREKPTATDTPGATSQPKPPQSPAEGQPKPPPPDQATPAVGQATNQNLPSGQDKLAQGPVNQVNASTDSNQGYFHGQGPVQINLRGQTPGQGKTHQAGDKTLLAKGAAAGSVKPTHVPAAGQPSMTDKIEPDAALLAELDKIKVEEVVFLEQYKQWKKQYDDWRDQNQNHPNKEQFEQYLQQWRTYEQQMEARRKNIQDEKQNIENKLAQQAAASQASSVRLGTFVQTFKPEGTSQDVPSSSHWETETVSAPSQNAGHNIQNMPLQSLRTGDPGVVNAQRFDGIGGSAANVSLKTNQFSGSAGNGEKAPGEDEKGEEDMNLDDEENATGGIIESGQAADGSAWEGSQAPDTDNRQPHSDWQSWNQGREEQNNSQWDVQGDNFGRDPDWTGQRGGHFPETGGFRGRGRGDWNSFNPDQRHLFGAEGPAVDSDSRFARPGSDGELGQQGGDFIQETFNKDYYNQFTDDVSFNVDGGGRGGFSGGRGPWHMGNDSGFHRGRGRGDDFQMRRGYGGDPPVGGSDFPVSGGDFPRGGGDFPRGGGSEFQRGRGGGFQRGGDFQRPQMGDYQSEDVDRFLDPDAFEFRGGALLRGRGGFPFRGRGGPASTLSQEFNEGRQNFTDFDPAVSGEEHRGV